MSTGWALVLLAVIANVQWNKTRRNYLETDTPIENNYVRFYGANTQWYHLYSFKDGDRKVKNNWIDIGERGNRRKRKAAQKTFISRGIPNSILELGVFTTPVYEENLGFLDPNFDYDAHYKTYITSKNAIYWRDAEIKYRKYDIQYVHGIKCLGTTHARSAIGYQGGYKSYALNCRYYSKSGVPRQLGMTYSYRGGSGDLRLNQSKKLMKQEGVPKTEAERILKADVKTMIESLDIKDMDVERMRKEGLLYDIPYQDFDG